MNRTSSALTSAWLLFVHVILEAERIVLLPTTTYFYEMHAAPAPWLARKNASLKHRVLKGLHPTSVFFILLYFYCILEIRPRARPPRNGTKAFKALLGSIPVAAAALALAVAVSVAVAVAVVVRPYKAL